MAGVSFAWAKATEGETYNDSYFTKNMTNARTAGVLIGAYHYAHPDTHIGASGANQEAAHFWNIASNYIKGSGTYMMPMLDLEVDHQRIHQLHSLRLGQCMVLQHRQPGCFQWRHRHAGRLHLHLLLHR